MDLEKKEGNGFPRKDTRGFTLVEVIIASAFFSLLSLALFATLSSASNIMQMQTLNAGINQGGMQLIRSIGREIAESSPVADQSHLIVTTDASANSVVTFQVPIDSEKDGNLVKNLDAAGNPLPAAAILNQTVEWGAYRFVREPQQLSWLNYWVRYRVLNNQLLREILPTSNGSATATDIIIPADVLAFQVAPLTPRRYNVILTIRKTDLIGKKSSNARTYQTTFDGDVLLRNGG